MLSKLDKAIISLISMDMPLTKEPYMDLARKLGIEQRVLLKQIRFFKKNGHMRKLSAILNHRKIGFRYNAMVVWNIPEELIDKAGCVMAAFDEVSHCYQREKAPGWNYNLYSMVHGKTRNECFNVVNNISKKTACKDYKVLFSSYEYKKSAAKY